MVYLEGRSGFSDGLPREQVWFPVMVYLEGRSDSSGGVPRGQVWFPVMVYLEGRSIYLFCIVSYFYFRT